MSTLSNLRTEDGTGRTSSDSERLRDLGRAVIETERDAVAALVSRVDEQFTRACRYMLRCQGRVVVTGMGKSGHVGSKIAATLASTGTPAFFVHPGEAGHGDMGMITALDVVLALSNSGETDELLTILPLIKRLSVPLIALTGKLDSQLGREASAVIDVSVAKEACPLGLAPTASTTAALVMGDAMAVALLEARGFTAEDFALAHPGGSLGRRLLLHVADVMHTGNGIPIVPKGASLSEALLEITRKRLGMTAVVDDADSLLGIFTDGDLRRTLDGEVDVRSTPVEQVMTRGCKTISPGVLAAEALEVMEHHKINALLVTNEAGKIVGALNLHDMLRARVV
jgi:arabinose-5-phosphate isomerase